MKIRTSMRTSMWRVAVSLMAGAMLCAPAAAQLRVGQKMPAWSVRDLNGRVLSSQTFKNRPLWITFFHST